MARDPVTGGKPSLGKLLKETRVDHKRTQRQVDLETGIQQNRLSAYENNRQPMSVKTLEKLAAAIGLDLPWEPGAFDDDATDGFLHLVRYLRERWGPPICLPAPPSGMSPRWLT